MIILVQKIKEEDKSLCFYFTIHNSISKPIKMSAALMNVFISLCFCL